jgi:hypothetical protein
MISNHFDDDLKKLDMLYHLGYLYVICYICGDSDSCSS